MDQRMNQDGRAFRATCMLYLKHVCCLTHQTERKLEHHLALIQAPFESPGYIFCNFIFIDNFISD